MKVSFSGVVGRLAKRPYADQGLVFMAEEMIKHWKIVQDELKKGNDSALKEFAETYV